MMAAFALPSDIEAVWRPLSPAETTLAEGLIARALMKLRLYARNRGVDIDVLFDSDPVLADAIKAVIVNAAKRVMINPDAVRQMSRTTGPWSESKTIDTAVSSGALYLDTADLVDLFPRRSPFGSFRVRGGLA